MIVAEVFALINAHQFAFKAVSRRNFREGINIVRHRIDELTTERINEIFHGRIFRNVSQHGQSLDEHTDAI